MGELKIVLPDEIERTFRKIAMIRFGFKKGAMSEAAKEAISEWSNVGKDVQIEDWDSLEGCMKHVKKDSVDLQHEAWKSVANKYTKKKNANSC